MLLRLEDMHTRLICSEPGPFTLRAIRRRQPYLTDIVERDAQFLRTTACQMQTTMARHANKTLAKYRPDISTSRLGDSTADMF